MTDVPQSKARIKQSWLRAYPLPRFAEKPKQKTQNKTKKMAQNEIIKQNEMKQSGKQRNNETTQTAKEMSPKNADDLRRVRWECRKFS